MGCNCGNKRRQVTGYGTNVPTGRPAPTTPTPTTQPATLRTTDGQVLTFGSRLEAHAERIRRGGGTVSTQ